MTAATVVPSGEYRIPPWAVRAGILAVAVGLWELLAWREIIEPLVAPRPSEVTGEFPSVLSGDDFRQDLTRTATSVGLAFAIGLVAGVAGGVLLWRFRNVAAALEPYVVTMYAMPTLVFYPLLLALMGLNAGPIVVITSVFSVVPVLISTKIALQSISPTLVKLARATCRTRRQQWLKVLVPAAVPLFVPGIKLGLIYSIVGAVAMEFILANRGLGFAIGVNYESYEITTMFVYIVVVIMIAVGLNAALTAFERSIRRGML